MFRLFIAVKINGASLFLTPVGDWSFMRSKAASFRDHHDAQFCLNLWASHFPQAEIIDWQTLNGGR